MTPEEFQRKKKELERLRSRLDRAMGAVDQLIQELKDEYGVNSVEAGQKLLSKLKKQENEQAEKAEQAEKDFNVRWSELLDEE